MKNNVNPAKLALRLETVKMLKLSELTNIIGGAATAHCQHPTTTVLPTGRC